MTALYEILLYVSIGVFAMMAAIYVRSGRASMFHPVTVYLAFHFVTFVVRPPFAYYLQYNDMYDAFNFHPTIEEKIIVVLATNLGVVTFVLAGLWFGRAQTRLGEVSDWQLNRYLKPVLVTCVVLGIPAAWSLWTVLGMTSLGMTESQYQLDYATGVTINTTSNGYLLEAQLMLATLVGMFAYVFRFRWWSILPFVAFVILRAGTGGRGPFIAATFFFILLYLYHSRQRWLTATTVALGGLALVLFRLVGDYRLSGFQELFAGKTAGENVERLRFLESMDWANLEFFEYLVHVVPKRTETYGYFVSVLQLFTEPIPRVLWEDKPIGAPIKLFNLFDYGTPYGGTYSLPGAGWLELGWVGIVILCVVFAWLYGKAYNRFMDRPQSPYTVMLYCAFLATLIVAVRDGLLITVARQALFYVAPVFAMQLFAIAYGVAGRPATDEPEAGTPGAETLATSPQERRKLRAAEFSGSGL